jgi:hypothetical protein
MADIIAETKTAPADTSLAIFAKGSVLVVTKLMVVSMAVLIISIEITKPKHNIHINHSKVLR